MNINDIIFQELKASKKYKYVCEDTLNRIAGWAVERYDPKKAVKAAKNKLHQVYGAYFEKMNLDKIREQMEKLAGIGSPDETVLKATALTIMKHHTSTAERLPFMEQFYRDLFARIGKPRKILDLACGLNPFSVPWMGLEAGVEYFAFDIDTRLMSAINEFFKYLAGPYMARCSDILVSLPQEEVDVVFLLKTLPCLEQQEKGISEKLIKALKAKYVVISFPSKSLTGKAKGMAGHYGRFILGILEKMRLGYFKMEYANEVFYIVGERNDE
ncbi:MAG: rRNA ((1405)-N(7))-methyltransferase [Acidobacteriota bacterium]|nr:rRNA ((1405)-N(7))-methyltransferase [Acidobacteriota bacterium]